MVDEIGEAKLKSIGVKDSKLLSPLQRDVFAEKIKKIVGGYKIIIINPEEIDESVESEVLNLNWLEAIKTAEILNALKPNRAYIDCPSTNTKAYTDYLTNLLETELELVVEHKADLKFPVVSAASILAKVIRDNEIKKIQNQIGKSIGSGYPSDPTTIKFLEENYNKYPEIFRRSWATYKKVAEKNQKKLNEF